ACSYFGCRSFGKQMPFLCPRDAIPYQLTKTLSLQEMASVCITDAVRSVIKCHSFAHQMPLLRNWMGM
ncbi:MAG TPA: hypothetical protein VJC37_00775, partial [Planctomycetota bacterium]|nr:hypothetical protein [Planctomycetota bacterium]